MDKVLNDVKLRCRQISACTRLRDSVKFSFFSNMAERLANNGQKWMKIGKIHPCIYSKKFRGVVFEKKIWLKLKSPYYGFVAPRQLLVPGIFSIN